MSRPTRACLSSNAFRLLRYCVVSSAQGFKPRRAEFARPGRSWRLEGAARHDAPQTCDIHGVEERRRRGLGIHSTATVTGIVQGSHGVGERVRTAGAVAVACEPHRAAGDCLRGDSPPMSKRQGRDDALALVDNSNGLIHRLLEQRIQLVPRMLGDQREPLQKSGTDTKELGHNHCGAAALKCAWHKQGSWLRPRPSGEQGL